MWLLDANMDVHLVELLSHFGLNRDTAANRGCKFLSNGQLVAVAVTQGFTCLLTRDRSFAESASKALAFTKVWGCPGEPAATALACVSRTFSARLAGLANSASGGRRHSVARSGAPEG